jgi:hypothetical protein
VENVRIRKDELLSVLEHNRSEHASIFEEAQAGYRRQVIAELDAMLAEAKAGRRIRRAVNLVEPVNQTAEYDRAIRMLKMSADEFIVLNENDFNCYVMDNWRWSQQFRSSNVGYSTKMRSMMPDAEV